MQEPANSMNRTLIAVLTGLAFSCGKSEDTKKPGSSTPSYYSVNGGSTEVMRMKSFRKF